MKNKIGYYFVWWYPNNDELCTSEEIQTLEKAKEFVKEELLKKDIDENTITIFKISHLYHPMKNGKKYNITNVINGF